ncbi:MAG TPA: phenylalanine--tRNA ligase beta subunit-related protein [Negativicutes bacterium]
MKFVVAKEVFTKLESVCFGIVVARGIKKNAQSTEIAELLTNSIKNVEARFDSTKVKEAGEIGAYREAFTKLGINPNKFMSSIEAMATRIAKKKGFPQINSIVDLGNAISLKYLVPLGAHDLDDASGDISVRFSNQGDRFLPFGETQEEVLEQGELIYSVGDQVKTRRWIWRQSEQGKVNENSKNIFFPIDGFHEQNNLQVIAARDELASRLQQWFDCEIVVGLVDKQNRELEF